jgi:hypothetical protein
MFSLLSLLFVRQLYATFCLKREELGFQQNGVHPVHGELLRRHTLVFEKAHRSKGRSTQHTHPGQRFIAEPVLQAEVQDNGNNDRQCAAYTLAKIQAEE